MNISLKMLENFHKILGICIFIVKNGETTNIVKLKLLFIFTFFMVDFKKYSQAKADVLRSSKRQSFESPMMGSLKLSPLGLASTLMRLMSQPHGEVFIPSAGLERHRQCFQRSKSTPPSWVEGQRQKV